MSTRRGSARLVIALTLGVVSTMLTQSPAQAAGVVSTTGTTVVSAPLNSTTSLPGLSVSDTDSSDDLHVSLSTDLGTVALDTTTGLTLDYGYSSFSGAAISFTGTPAAVNTGLASATLTTEGVAGTADVSLSAMVSAPGYVYSPTNGHFYKFVASSGVSWTAAQTAAAGLSFNGQAGYLATMPTAATNNVVANRIPGATNAWIGAQSTDTPGAAIQRTWKWDDGPSAGQVISYCSNFTGVCDFVDNTGLYSHFASGEPNNQGGTTSHSGEWVAVTNWDGTYGNWNDLEPTSSSASGYVVEYGDRVNGSSGFSGVSTSESDVRVESAPDAPTDVSAERGDTKATVTFTAPSANGSPITGYTVTTTTGATSTTSSCREAPCTVSGLTNGTAYTFTVRATNAVGTSEASDPSDEVTPAAVPDPPTDVSATRGQEQATVSFTAPEGNGSPVTGYSVRAVSGGSGVTSSCAASPCTVTGLTNGTAYTFTVKAINAVGSSVASDPSDAVTPAGVPAKPSGVSAVRGNESAQVSFTAVANGSPITDYTVTSTPGGVTQTCSVSPCTVSGLTNGTAYTFTVEATNTVGTSEVSEASNEVTPAAVPDPPTDVSAVRGDQEAVVSFDTPDAQGDGITGYSVRAVSGGQGLSSPCAASPCTVTGLTNGKAYTFTVKAINAVGSSVASDPSDAVTPAGVPAKPVVSAVRGNESAQVSFTTAANGSPITDYTVTSTPGGVTQTCAASPCTVSGLTNGTAYTFTIEATNAVGTSEASEASNEVTPATVPGRPASLDVESQDGSLLVTFAPPSSDGGSAVTGYQFSIDAGQTWSVLTTTGSTSLQATIPDLTNGTAYVVLVRAVNDVDHGTSAEGDDTTPAGAPGPVRDVAAVVTGTSATVTWTAPIDDGGAPMVSYDVTSVPAVPTCTTATTSCTLTGLTPGTSYVFSVSADNTHSGQGATGSGPQTSTGSVLVPVVPVVPAAPGSPGALAVLGRDRTLHLSFAAPVDPGTDVITGYQVRVRQGRSPGGTATGRWQRGSWRPLLPSGTDSLTATFAPVKNGRSYAVQVRAVNSVGSGVSTPVSRVRVAAWYADPISAKKRAEEVKVPQNPREYVGPSRHTVATRRSADGRPVTSLSKVRGRELQAGQGVQFRARQLFAPGSSRLTSGGRSRLRSLADSLTWVGAVSCEGYVDYGTPRSPGRRLSTRRARVVCAGLASRGVQATRVSKGYGGARPQVISLSPDTRGPNNRIVVIATKG